MVVQEMSDESKVSSCFCEFENGQDALSPRSVAGGLASVSSRSSWDSSSGLSCCRTNVRSSLDGTVRNLDFDHTKAPANVVPSEEAASCNRRESCQGLGHELLSSVLPTPDERAQQQKISELRVALQASDRARQEAEKETESLRAYLAKVESGASSLHLRVQELEQQLQLARAHDGSNLEHLRGKLLQDALQEAQSQAAAAAQAVVVAREATMELDKMKRDCLALVHSQKDEITRLCKEVENTRVLYQARYGQVEALKEQIQELERSMFAQSQRADAALKESKVDVPEMQKKIETLQLAAKQREVECNRLRETVDSTSKMAKSLERRLQDAQAEKTELKFHNDCLEQQVNELQSRQVMATIAHYDCELQKVRAVLGGEKAHLLSELALLRCRNKSLRGDLAEWQEKYKALSNHVSGLEPSSTTSEYQMIENPLWEGERCERRQNEAEVKQQHRRQHSAGEEMERSEPGHHEKGDNTIPLQSQGTTAKQNEPSQKICRKDRCSCETRDNILAAAHKEIIKLNEINQWLLAACHNDVALNKFTRSS